MNEWKGMGIWMNEQQLYDIEAWNDAVKINNGDDDVGGREKKLIE